MKTIYVLRILSLILWTNSGFIFHNQVYATEMNLESMPPCSTPPAPTSVSTTSTRYTITFDNIGNGLAGNSTHIEIELCVYNYGGCTTISTSASPPYTFTGLQCNKTYYYRIRNLDSGGPGCYSSELTGYVSTNPCSTTPSNDNCISATLLTIDDGCRNFNTSNTNYDLSENFCGSNTYSWCHWESIWFVFEAESFESTVLIDEYYGGTTFQTDIVSFGPYNSLIEAQADCYPTGNNIVSNNGNCIRDIEYYDNFFSYSFDTEPNKYYLIQFLNEDCSYLSSGAYNYYGCIDIFNTPINNTPEGADIIDQCGVTYNGTNIGYSPSNGLPGIENLDNNGSTTCSNCTSGEDVSYIVNNDSWFYFCTSSDGDWQIDFNGISDCLSGNTSNSGLQMTIFTGDPTNFTPLWNANSPSPPGSSQTSPILSLLSGQCVYLVVDGFAGDQCNYSYTLQNLNGPCEIISLSDELINYVVFNNNKTNNLYWTTTNTFPTDYFLLESSSNGMNWNFISKIEGHNTFDEEASYQVSDNSYSFSLNYYRLSKYNLDGELQWSKTISIDNTNPNPNIIGQYNILGQPVDSQYKGLVLQVLDNGKIIKTHRK